MSAEELVTWQAWLRRNPRGLKWDNWVQAALTREVNRLLPRKQGTRLPKFEEFVWKPPAPLFIETEKQKAKRRRAGKKDSK